MKKVGIMIFVVALVAGLVASNLFSFGHFGGRMFTWSMNFGGVQGSGNVITEKRDLSGFKSVEVGGVFQVEIVSGKEYAVEVEADDNLVPLISTVVDGDTLRISSEKRIGNSKALKIRVYAPDVTGVKSSGASSVTLSGVKNSALAVESNGASRLKVSGATTTLTADVSGASNIDSGDLTATDAVVNASGASHINVNVTGSLKADATGAGHITYLGPPSSVSAKKSGAGSVTAK